MDTINRLETWDADINQAHHTATLAELTMAQDVLRNIIRLGLPPDDITKQLACISIIEAELSTYAI
jgi:hypothetical protein